MTATVGLIWSGTHGGDVALKRAGEMLQVAVQECEGEFLHRRQLSSAAADRQASGRGV